MSIFMDKIRKPKSCYDCSHNCIMSEDTENESWACDEIYGVPIGTNPPYDEPCDFFAQKEEKKKP